MRKIVLLLFVTLSLFAVSGEEVFKSYCWGCHHQSAMAFGPSFKEIANKRTKDEIRAMITDPKNISKEFGYKRNAMPSFKLKEDELEAISNYILSFKDSNQTKSSK